MHPRHTLGAAMILLEREWCGMAWPVGAWFWMLRDTPGPGRAAPAAGADQADGRAADATACDAAETSRCPAAGRGCG